MNLNCRSCRTSIPRKRRGNYNNNNNNIIQVGTKQRKRDEIESSEKNRPCLIKMMTPPLPCRLSEECQIGIKYNQIAEYSGIRTKVDNLKSDSCIQLRFTGWNEIK